MVVCSGNIKKSFSLPKSKLMKRFIHCLKLFVITVRVIMSFKMIHHSQSNGFVIGKNMMCVCVCGDGAFSIYEIEKH